MKNDVQRFKRSIGLIIEFFNKADSAALIALLIPSKHGFDHVPQPCQKCPSTQTGRG